MISVVNSDDVALVKEYLAGNIQLTDDLCTVSFDTDGGGEIAPIKVGRNYAIMQEIPSPGKDGEIFVGWQKEDGTDFYQTEPVTGDMTLRAVYEPMDPAEQVYIDSFALTDQKTDLEIGITAPGKTAEQVKAAITLLTKDGSDPVDLVVADNGGSFTVHADGGFRAGGTYEMTLGEGLTFTDRDERYRTVVLTFAKEEEDNIAFDPDVVFIQDTDEYSYCDFPSEHWTRIRTNNVIERLNREIRRRTRVVGSFPDGNSALMLVCARLRHVAGTQWGNKKYMNMKHLEATLEHASFAG